MTFGPVPRSGVYTGPIPSQARRWAPWVIVTTAAAATGNAVVFVLNLVERHYQQQRLTPNPPSVTNIRNTISNIHTVTSITLAVTAAFLVVAIMWGVKRRPRSRLRRDGENGVEPALRKIIPFVYVTLFAALAISWITTVSAASAVHTGSTIQDFVTYRTRLAIGAASRSVMWACWIPLVARATQLQQQREAAAIASRGH